MIHTKSSKLTTPNPPLNLFVRASSSHFNFVIEKSSNDEWKSMQSSAYMLYMLAESDVRQVHAMQQYEKVIMVESHRDTS